MMMRLKKDFFFLLLSSHAFGLQGHFTSSKERTSVAVSSGVGSVCVERAFRAPPIS